MDEQMAKEAFKGSIILQVEDSYRFMYLKEAINRVNKIERKKADSVVEKYVGDLVYEYLRRMAGFVKEQNMSPYNVKPLFINVAFQLGDSSEKNYIKYCSLEIQKELTNTIVPEYNLNCYLQLVDYAEEDKELEQYLQIYEPLIQLIERGFLYSIREGGFMVYGVGFYPLHGWYERCLNASEKPIDRNNHMVSN